MILIDWVRIDIGNIDFNFIIAKHICLEGIVDSLIENLKYKLRMLPDLNDKEFNVDLEFNLGIVKTTFKAQSEAEHISPDIINLQTY